MLLYQTELFEKILVTPAVSENVDTLNIVSGYATSAMAFHHLYLLIKECKKNIKINLTIGMTPNDGLSISNHRGFVEIATNDFPINFSCNYLTKRPQVHSKLYVWCKGKNPVQAYIGSANYTQTALRFGTQREVMSMCDAPAALDYYNAIQPDTIYCNHQDVANEILLFKDNYRRNVPSDAEEKSVDIATAPTYGSLSSVTIPLFDKKTGEVQKIAGLNWGQRSRREPNQAYIQLPPAVYRSDFFPLRSIRFTVLTDDERSFICTRAQKDDMGHAIETPQNNSLLGEYFRNRLGLGNGAFITRDNLNSYGRSDVSFYKIDDETYYMDFSVPLS